MGNRQSMEDHLFNLRFTAKQLQRESSKSLQSAETNKRKCKEAMEKGNMDGARIYAESSIRDKNTSLNYLRLSSRIDAVSQRVNTAVKMKTLTKNMSNIVGSMDSIMKTMNVEKITEVMDKFERQFEDLDLTTGVMESSIQQSTAQAMPEQQVESLMSQVADEYKLEYEGDLIGLGTAAGKVQHEKATEEKKAPVINVTAGPSNIPNRNNNKNNDGSSGDDASGGGGGVSAAPAASSNNMDDESLEARLRRLQGL